MTKYPTNRIHPKDKANKQTVIKQIYFKSHPKKTCYKTNKSPTLKYCKLIESNTHKLEVTKKRYNGWTNAA